MPDAFKAAKNKYRERVNNTYKENEGKPAKEQTKIRISGPDLFVINKLITGLIQPPTPGEVCRAHKSYAEELSSFELLATKPLGEKDSTFQGFAVHASNLLAVFLAYCKVRITIPLAKHIMCAYAVTGEEVVLAQFKETLPFNIILLVTDPEGRYIVAHVKL